jgi:Tetracyclin repressor-like, C-terminal domain
LGPNELRWTEAAVALLLDTGLDSAERLDTVVLLIGQVRVIAQQASAGTGAEDGIVAALTGVLAEHGDRFPALARTLAEGVPVEGRDAAFDFGLDRILDGLEALIRRRTGAAGG